MSNSMLPESKFMTNIAVDPAKRTKFVKALSFITPNAFVPLSRLLLSIAGVAVVTIVAVWLLMQAGAIKIGFILLPVLGLALGLYVLLVYFMLSSREESQIVSAYKLLLFKVTDRLRRKANVNASIKSVGIRSIERGLIYFDNGDVGMMYEVEGQMSKSVLPSVVEASTLVRAQYYVARPETSQETLITSINNVDATSQLATLRALREKTTDLWIRAMAKLNYNYIDSNMAKNETTIKQILIIRDDSLGNLKKDQQAFEAACQNGLYSAARQIMKSSSIIKWLAPLTMQSLKSQEKKQVVDEKDVKSPHALMESLPYTATPSFIEHNGRVMSILKLYVRPGTNRQLTHTEVIDLIPAETLTGVDMHFIINDRLIKHDEKKRLIQKNSGRSKDAITQTQKHGDKEENDSSAQLAQQADLEDYDEYELILDSAEPVVYYKINLVVIGNSRQQVDEQIDILNKVLDQRHEGCAWDSLGGDQLDRFEGLFAPLVNPAHERTSTGSNYARMNFAVNAGLNDPKGLPIGSDVLSLSSSSSFFDFQRSTRTQAIIAIPKSSVMNWYFKEGEIDQPPVASIIAQYAANQIVMNGHRAHHLVLNNFDYMEKNLYYRPLETETLFDSFDVSRLTINPLQGYGSINDVVAVFNRLVQKVVNVFDILQDYHMTQDDKAVVLKVIEQFYFNQKLWNASAAERPASTRIVEIPDPSTYPTMSSVLVEFSTLIKSASRDNRELKADRIDTIKSILNQALSANMSVIGRTSNIPVSDSSQVYYNFSKIQDNKIQLVQLINLIEYVAWTAERDDVIILHGCDRISQPVMAMMYDAIKAAQYKGIRFIFAFDTVSNQADRISEKADIFSMRGIYYKDLDTDVDWTIIGKCMAEEVEKFETALNQGLSQTIRAQMQAKMACQALVHRNLGDVNNFVNLRVII